MKAFVGATVITMDGQPIENGTVLIKEGKIADVGAGIAIPEGAEVVDVKGKYITPGLIDAHTHLGVYSESLAWSGEDGNERSQPLTPGIEVIDAIYPDDVGIADTCAGGVTLAMVAPGSANPVGGQCSIIKTRPRATVEEMVIKRHAGLKIAFGENPKRVYSEQKKMPVTRMGTAAVIREAFYSAKEYLAKEGDKDRKFDLGMEALARVLRKEMPLRAHAHRADDIVTAFRIAEEFDVDIIIEHGTEAHLIADVLAKKNARVILGPLMTTRSKMELKDRSYSAPRILHEHGVKFAVMSDHPVIPCCYLSVYVGLAVRYGLPKEAALRAITIDAAEILGMADRVGSLTAGKDADLVVWTDEPLSLTAKPEMVVIDGVIATVDRDQKLAGWSDEGGCCCSGGSCNWNA